MIGTRKRMLAAVFAGLIVAVATVAARAAGDDEMAVALNEAADYKYASALEHFRLAAEQGNVAAQRTTGLMLLLGESLYDNDVKGNRQEAVKWLSRAAANGCGVSGLVLARLERGATGSLALQGLQRGGMAQ